ncbi:hypothetical protein H4R20_004381 [Coemansia guatemalensis]|uniref:DUF202 domain-containing protein n=1 Tax=Coemansia guatemalensis TaxID=2761395 RepID=A0A9W8HS58_9FUNG|nr:hypothetical protein H4R20_004381 [Coemansia guatemalensis]
MDRQRLYTETDALLPRPQRQRHSRNSSDTTTSRLTWDDRGSGNGLKLGICGVPNTIENVGSTARDFYAAERNCLSWIRLSVAIMSTGAAVMGDISGLRNPFSGDSEMTRMYIWLVDYVERHGMILGLLLFVLSAFVVLSALTVFCHAQAQLAVARRPLRWSNTLLVAATFAVAASSLLVTVSVMHA